MRSSRRRSSVSAFPPAVTRVAPGCAGVATVRTLERTASRESEAGLPVRRVHLDGVTGRVGHRLHLRRPAVSPKMRTAPTVDASHGRTVLNEPWKIPQSRQIQGKSPLMLLNNIDQWYQSGRAVLPNHVHLLAALPDEGTILSASTCFVRAGRVGLDVEHLDYCPAKRQQRYQNGGRTRICRRQDGQMTARSDRT